MRVFDRYQAIEVDLPEVVEPGRYRLLRRTVLNGSTELPAGDLLWSDGGNLCDLEGEASRTYVGKDDEQEGDIPDSVVDGAVSAVVDQLRTGSPDLPSPVMPARLGDLASATPLELELESIMGRGHLQAIAARPRMAMRYESELLPVSRARRLAVRDVMPRLHKSLPQYLSRDQIRAVLAAATNPHHHMIIRLALGTGLRKEELATFPRAYVFDPDLAHRPGRNIRVRLDPRDGHGMKTKGDKPRDIYIGRALMKDLNHYAVHRRGLRASLGRNPQPALFLNQSGAPFSADGKSLDRIVRLIGERAGVHTWTHLLRHTYATHTLVALQRTRDRNRIEPVVFVQRQLGHASVQTTMVYLHLVQDLADDAVLTYDDELDD